MKNGKTNTANGTFEMTFEWENENGEKMTSELEFEYFADNLYNDFELEIINCEGDELPEEFEEDAKEEAAYKFEEIMEDLYEPCY